MPKKKGMEWKVEDTWWLGQQWVKANERFPSVDEIMKGIQKEE